MGFYWADYSHSDNWLMFIVIAIVYFKYNVIFKINQQRRCRVALHFTWFIVALTFIWFGVYNYWYVMHTEMVFPKRSAINTDMYSPSTSICSNSISKFSTMSKVLHTKSNNRTIVSICILHLFYLGSQISLTG